MMLTKVLSCLTLLSGQSVYAFVPPSITATATKTTTVGSALYSTTKSNDENGVDGRRAFLSTSTVACLACLFKPTFAHADGGDVDYKAVAADIADIIKKNPDKGPTLVRLVSIGVMSSMFLALYIDIDSRIYNTIQSISYMSLIFNVDSRISNLFN